MYCKYSSFLLCLTVSCVEEILKADPGQLQAEDSLYGGTPLHWSKTAEVKNIIVIVIMCFVVRIHNELFEFALVHQFSLN